MRKVEGRERKEIEDKGEREREKEMIRSEKIRKEKSRRERNV